MYLNAGNEELLKRNIIGIFDLDTSTVSKKTRDFLAAAQTNGNVVDLTADLPRSFILSGAPQEEATVYLSQYSAGTLLGRAEDVY